MTSSAENTKKCGVCLGNLAAGKGQAIFTAECSHTFHFGCISSKGSNLCPVCNATWKVSASPHPASSISPTSRYSIYQAPRFPRGPSYQFPVQPTFESEPVLFSDDEPLPVIQTNPIFSLQKVSLRAIPERQAVAASEALSEFDVLVVLKAPSLSAHPLGRAAVDLVMVLDISGSMSGSKLSLLKHAVHFVIDNLGSSDRLSIVSFATDARRILPLRRMTQNGREAAKIAVDSLDADGLTNIVAALEKGAKVLEERQQQNPVANIIFLSDGVDTCYRGDFRTAAPRTKPAYLHLLPDSICPKNKSTGGQQKTFPVHTFGFGSDHDPLAMHAIANASGGTFSFIESYEMVQDAFASCIGGLLSVMTQELHLTMRAASHGVEIKSIPSGRYESQVCEEGSRGILYVGDLYADEEKEFLINLSVSSLQNNDDDDDETDWKSSLLDIMCSYRDSASKEMVRIECDLVEIQRPKSVSSQDLLIDLEVDRQRNRLSALLTITEAQQMAEAGNLGRAQTHLSNGRSNLHSTRSAQAGDALCMWLDAEMKETENLMQSEQLYGRQGRAYTLSGMSSHTSQRATTRGTNVPGASAAGGGRGSGSGFHGGRGGGRNTAVFDGYVTPNMTNMVHKSQLEGKTQGAPPI